MYDLRPLLWHFLAVLAGLLLIAHGPTPFPCPGWARALVAFPWWLVGVVCPLLKHTPPVPVLGGGFAPRPVEPPARVRFDRNGAAYVDAAELLRDPRVRAQYEAARRVVRGA